MLPDWEKEKIKAQNKGIENQANDKNQNAVPVPVVKDASEFRELTQVRSLQRNSSYFLADLCIEYSFSKFIFILAG